MHWDGLFDDLEGQLASEWEAERVALDAESERLRISRLDLRDRLRSLCRDGAEATIDLAGARRSGARLLALGADWLAASSLASEGALARRSITVIPLQAIRGLGVDHGLLLGSLEGVQEQSGALRERMTLGFLMRDLARRRVPVGVNLIDGDELHGTIDRAGLDHFDLARHERGIARFATSVQGFHVIPFGAVAYVEVPGDQLP